MIEEFLCEIVMFACLRIMPPCLVVFTAVLEPSPPVRLTPHAYVGRQKFPNEFLPTTHRPPLPLACGRKHLRPARCMHVVLFWRVPCILHSFVERNCRPPLVVLFPPSLPPSPIPNICCFRFI